MIENQNRGAKFFTEPAHQARVAVLGVWAFALTALYLEPSDAKGLVVLGCGVFLAIFIPLWVWFSGAVTEDLLIRFLVGFGWGSGTYMIGFKQGLGTDIWPALVGLFLASGGILMFYAIMGRGPFHRKERKAEVEETLKVTATDEEAEQAIAQLSEVKKESSKLKALPVVAALLLLLPGLVQANPLLPLMLGSTALFGAGTLASSLTNIAMTGLIIAYPAAALGLTLLIIAAPALGKLGPIYQKPAYASAYAGLALIGWQLTGHHFPALWAWASESHLHDILSYAGVGGGSAWGGWIFRGNRA